MHAQITVMALWWHR